MSQKVVFFVLVSLLFVQQIFAMSEPNEEHVIPEGIRNNEFYLESLRLTKLAHDTFEFGDYDASAGFAQEAIRFAQLSDEFVVVQLIAEAKRLLDWADANNMDTRYPDEYNEGKNSYEASVIAHDDEKWNEAIALAARSVGILAALEADGPSLLPSQYTVRTWAESSDCLWTIAGYSWVYGDPYRWRVLFESKQIHNARSR